MEVLNAKLPEEFNVDGESLQGEKWASVTTIVLRVLQHCLCNAK